MLQLNKRTLALTTAFCTLLWMSHSALTLAEELNTDTSQTKRVIQFRFTGIKRPGIIHYSIYCNPEAYGKAGNAGIIGTVEGSLSVSAGKELTLPIEIATQESSCALLFYIDENGNGVLDRSRFLGLPKEGVGFSRVAGKPLSKPSWEDTRFELSTTTTVTAKAFYY